MLYAIQNKWLRYFGNRSQRHYANPKNYRYGIDVDNVVWTFVKRHDASDWWMVLHGVTKPSPWHHALGLLIDSFDTMIGTDLNFVNSDGRADTLYLARTTTGKFISESEEEWTADGHLPCWIGRDLKSLVGIATAFEMSAKAMKQALGVDNVGYRWTLTKNAIEKDEAQRKQQVS